MNEKKGSLKNGMLLVAFGVALYSLLQNLGVIVDGWRRISNIISPIVTGLCIAFVLNVLMSACERMFERLYLFCKGKKKWKGEPNKRLVRGLSLLLSLLLAASLIALTLVAIVPKLTEVFTMFVSDLPQSTRELSLLLGNFLSNIGIDVVTIENLKTSIDSLGKQMQDLLQEHGLSIAGFTLDVTSSLLSTVTDFVFSMIIAIYVLLDKERIGRFVKAIIRRFMPEKIAVHVMRLSTMSYTTFTAFVRGQFLEAIVLGVLCFIGMVIFQFPYAPVISLLIGVTALIPIVGAWIGGIVAALLVLLVSPIKALLLIVYILVLQQLEGNLIYPKVVGSTIGLPGVLVLSAVIIGQGLMGIVGILISVPLTAVLYTVLKEAVYAIRESKKPDREVVSK